MLAKSRMHLAPPSALVRSRHPNAKAFRRFHKHHPEVFDAFVAQANALYSTGGKANALAILQTLRAAGAPINNNHAPFYARMYESYFGRGLFRLRAI